MDETYTAAVSGIQAIERGGEAHDASELEEASIEVQTTLVGEGCNRVCQITNSASRGRGVAEFVTLQTMLVGGGV